MVIHNRIFTSLDAFNAERDSLPYPSVCKITDGSDLFVFFRHSSSTTADTMYTVGACRFHIDYSVLDGKALLQ